MNNKKIIKRLKLFTIICVIVLIIELVFIGYSLLFKNKESLYFDGINAIETNNNYYVTVGSNNDNINNYEKAKISQYNMKKEKVFEKLYNVGYNSAFFGVCLDEDNIVVVGSYEKTKEEHENLIRRAIIVKYDSEGKIVFEKDFKLLDNSKFTSIVKVDDGYIVTGQSVYQITHVGNMPGGALLAKYSKDGELLWNRTYGSNNSASFNDLVVNNGYIYTVGVDNDYLGIICKYDLNGKFISYNDYKYTDELGFSGIEIINDNIYISGSNRGSKNYINAMIVKYDLDCTYLDEVIHEDKGITRYNKLIKDSHDNIIGIGIMTTNKTTNRKKLKTAETINYDGIIGKYNKNLKEISTVTYGDERDDYFNDIKMVDNDYLVVGYSSYEDGSYLSKFIRYSDALKLLGVD